MEDVIINNRKAGFWVRFAATWIDLFIVWIVVRTAFALLNHFDIYVPLEITVVLSFLVYSVILIGWRGCTVGKWLCGLTVQSSKGKPIGYVRAFLRETIGKFLSAVFLFLGFVWVAFSRKKRGWHDYLARTNVRQANENIKRGRVILWVVLTINAAFWGSKLFVTVRRCSDAIKIAVAQNVITTPQLTLEDRRMDIEYLAQWARDYSPMVELTEKHRGNPSYEALLPKYLEYAEQAESNEEFFQVVSGYLKLICSAGHRYLISEDDLKIISIGTALEMVDLDISSSAFNQAQYWPGLVLNGNLSTHAHPPFHIAYKDDIYLTDDDWQEGDVTIPKGSQIIKVNGMDCTSYLEHIRENTYLKYDAVPRDWTKEHLLIIDQGDDFKGWQVEFLLPDNSIHSAFVPRIKGWPAPKSYTIQPNENCTCIELTDEAAYIRVKIMRRGMPWVNLFPSICKKDGKIIKTFLDNANGKYRKLIIDVRDNPGGMPYYVYENLIRPFLDVPVTYEQVAGIRRKYKDNLKKSVLESLRKFVSTKKQHVVKTEQVDAPDGFDSKDWVFYKLTRRIKPRNRYRFDGSLYVLINGDTGSAADDYANAVKRIGIAKLVGRNTFGNVAAYLAPPVITLPASGMIFVVETEIVINPDGSINEIFGTPPDVELAPADPPKSITKEELLKDEWIKYIINEM